MNKYELTIILDGKVTAAKKKSTLETIEKLSGLLKGKMGEVSDWGVKEMFHTIKKQNKGAYLNIPLELPADAIKQLDLKLKMEDNILRHLVVKL